MQIVFHVFRFGSFVMLVCTTNPRLYYMYAIDYASGQLREEYFILQSIISEN